MRFSCQQIVKPVILRHFTYILAHQKYLLSTPLPSIYFYRRGIILEQYFKFSLIPSIQRFLGLSLGHLPVACWLSFYSCSDSFFLFSAHSTSKPLPFYTVCYPLYGTKVLATRSLIKFTIFNQCISNFVIPHEPQLL